MQISRDFRPTKYVTKYRKTRQTKYQALLRLGVGNGKFERAKGLSSTFLLFFSYPFYPREARNPDKKNVIYASSFLTGDGVAPAPTYFELLCSFFS